MWAGLQRGGGKYSSGDVISIVPPPGAALGPGADWAGGDRRGGAGRGEWRAPAVSRQRGRPHFRLGVSGSRACGAGAGRSASLGRRRWDRGQVSDPGPARPPRRRGAAAGFRQAGGTAGGLGPRAGREAGPGQAGGSRSRSPAPTARRLGPTGPRPPARPGPDPRPGPGRVPGPRKLGRKVGGRRRGGGMAGPGPGGRRDPASPGNCGPGLPAPACARK